jgi:hypothetical protein
MQPCVLLAADEPLAGTAPHARGWILVEQPGAWARDALSGVPPVARVFTGIEADPGVRIQLIRRPGAQPARAAATRQVMLVHAGDRPWIEALEVTDDDLDAVNWQRVLDPDPPGVGTPSAHELLLVCTHGSRDRCCAEHGRPIAAALAARHPESVWETSHIGGHRFAGNVVVLPSGLVLGHLDAARALRAVEQLAAGRLPLDDLRGRSGLDPAAQAAEVLARAHLGLDRVGAVVASRDGDTIRIGLDGGTYRVRLHREPLGRAYPLSCGAVAAEDPGRWVLDALERAD